MIDLRSDTLTKPTDAMRRAMAAADVGDDVFGEDPTINQLETRVASLLGKEAALFVTSGTMGNQIAVRLHCQPGDELLCEQDCHIFHYEQTAHAQLFGVSARTVTGDNGLLTSDLLNDHLRADDVHHPRSRMVCLENTHNRLGGLILPHEGVAEVCHWAAGQGLKRHLDGARLWNAAVATGIPPAQWAAHFDTVSVCFSKGLGAPVGSALCGSAELIHQARRIRKVLGGGMRQAGILAAGALHALEHHVDRLADDHAHAQLLADAIRQTPQLTLVGDRCDTNIVLFDIDPQQETAAQYVARLEKQGAAMFDIGPQRVRAVTHLGVTRDDAQQAASLLATSCQAD